MTDASGVVYLRARYYVPGLGVFPSLDPVEEGNRYGYVGGDVVNRVDPSGMAMERPEKWIKCDETDPCSKYVHNDGYAYARCLTSRGRQPCPHGYPVGEGSKFGSDPYCVDGINGDYAGAMWEAIWAPIRAELPNIRCTAILGEARRLKGKSTGRQILSDLLRYAQNKFNYTSAQELSDDISCAVVGARGPSTVLAATPLNVGGIFGSISQFEEHLGYGGWHSDYEDGTDNQIFHFWSYVNTTAQGGSGSLGLGIFGDWFHECIDPRSDQVGQRTMEDVRTSYAGMILGLELYALQIRPDEIDDWVDRYLGSVSFYTLIQEKSMISVYNTLQTRICPLIGR